MIETTFYVENYGEKLFVRKFSPETEPIGVIQIVHGMISYSGRWYDTAKYFCDQGFVVFVSDLRGHGNSVKSKEVLGILDPDIGYKEIASDIDAIVNTYYPEYRLLPMFVIGHSFGSFITQYYLETYRKPNLKGIILSGTNGPRRLVMFLGKVACHLMTSICGYTNRATWLQKIMVNGYNSKFPEDSEAAWLSRDPEARETYEDSTENKFTISYGFCDTIVDVLHYIHRKKNMKLVPKDMPILMLTGSEDPLSDGGKRVDKLQKELTALGVKDITHVKYPGARHEPFNEINKDQVRQDALDWMHKHM